MVRTVVGEAANLADQPGYPRGAKVIEGDPLEQAPHQHVCLSFGEQSGVRFDPDLRSVVPKDPVGEPVIREDRDLFSRGQVDVG